MEGAPRLRGCFGAVAYCGQTLLQNLHQRGILQGSGDSFFVIELFIKCLLALM